MNKLKNKIPMKQFGLDIGVMLNLVQHLVLFKW
jgi:hypothetical protein